MQISHRAHKNRDKADSKLTIKAADSEPLIKRELC